MWCVKQVEAVYEKSNHLGPLIGIEFKTVNLTSMAERDLRETLIYLRSFYFSIQTFFTTFGSGVLCRYCLEYGVVVFLCVCQSYKV